MPLTHHTHIAAFLHYLKFQKRYSVHTVENYARDINGFKAYCDKEYEDVDIIHATTFMIRSWLADLREHQMQSRSVNRKISALKSFYKFLLRDKIIESTPMSGIISPKNSKRLPQYIEHVETQELIDGDLFGDDFKGKTQQLILAVLYSTGIRRAELLQLKERHVDYANKTIKVFGKGGKERLIPVQQVLLDSIRTYIHDKTSLETEADRTYLFVQPNGKQVNVSFIYNTVKKGLSGITTLKKKSPHILRHTFATHLMNNGADLNAVKELLGHASLAATQVYTHNNIEKLKSIHKQAHPKS
jgi:integrase/recombinase XerC